MDIENVVTFLESTLLHELDHTLHRFTLVDWVSEDTFSLGTESNGLNGLIIRNTVTWMSESCVEGNL